MSSALHRAPFGAPFGWAPLRLPGGPGPRGFGDQQQDTWTTVTDVAQKVAPVAKTLLEDRSATESVEVLRAQVKNHEALAKKFPEPLKTVYANKAAVLRARLRAALVAQRDEEASRKARADYVLLGKGATLTGIAVGFGVLYLLVSAGSAVGRSRS